MMCSQSDLRHAELAASQIFDLLSDMFGIELVSDRRQAPQQLRLLSGPGIEVFLVERVWCLGHRWNVTRQAAWRKVQPNECRTMV